MLGTTRRCLCAFTRISPGRRHHITTHISGQQNYQLLSTTSFSGIVNNLMSDANAPPTCCDLTEDDFLLQSFEIRQVEEDGSSHGVHPESRPRYASVFTPSAFPTTFHISYAPQVPIKAETRRTSSHPSCHITYFPATETTCHGHGEAIPTCLTGQASALCCPSRSRISLCYQRHLLDWCRFWLLS
jgi:hypothetical protein